MNVRETMFANLFGAREYNTCEICGNHYDKCFQVRIAGETHVFDSFECAIQALAPRCAHCGCRILGHGMETDGHFFCCAHCAEQYGIAGFQDRMKHSAERKDE